MQQGKGDESAPVTGAGIYEAFERLEVPNTKLVAAECRAETCRIEAEFGSIESYNEAFGRLFANAAPLIEHGGVRCPMPDQRDDGSQHAVIFVRVHPPQT